MLGMAGLLSLVAIVFGVVAFAASVWLVVVAFRRSALWGLLSLLVPFAAVAFAIKHWKEARKPFLVSVGAAVASGVLVFATAGLAASASARDRAPKPAADPSSADVAQRSPAREPAPAEGSGALEAAEPAPESASAEPIKLRVVGDEAAPAAPVAPAAPSPSAALYDAGEVTKDGYAPVSWNNASGLPGRWVKIVMANGRVHRGEVLKADADGLRLQRWLGGGTIVVDFRRSEIETLYVDVN